MAALNWEGWLTIAVVVATLAMLLWERFTPDKVLIGAAAVLMASGVLAPKEALAGFWNPGVLTVAVLFVLVAALKSTGAIRWIGGWILGRPKGEWQAQARLRSEEHTSELPPPMRNSYAVFCLKKKKNNKE